MSFKIFIQEYSCKVHVFLFCIFIESRSDTAACRLLSHHRIHVPCGIGMTRLLLQNHIVIGTNSSAQSALTALLFVSDHIPAVSVIPRRKTVLRTYVLTCPAHGTFLHITDCVHIPLSFMTIKQLSANSRILPVSAQSYRLSCENQPGYL